MARLLLTESLLLAILGAGLGLLIAGWCVNIMRTHMAPEMSRFLSGWQSLKLNGRALLSTTVVSVVAGILSGLAPTLHAAKTDLNQTLRQVGRQGRKPIEEFKRFWWWVRWLSRWCC